MPGRKPLTRPADVVYTYDGSLSGLYTCIHESVYLGQMPLDIQREGEGEPTLFPCRFIPTDEEKARKVRAAIDAKLRVRSRRLTEGVFLSCLIQKEMHILRFMLLGFQEGPGVLMKLSHPLVAPLYEAERALHKEAHLYRGFVRFSDYEGHLVAAIRPKNFVLPLLAEHFMERFPGEAFMIFDKTHGAALLYEKGRGEIVRAEGFLEGEATDREKSFRRLWKMYYDTIAIETRRNEKCRRTLMPKRYWSELTELKGEVGEG